MEKIKAILLAIIYNCNLYKGESYIFVVLIMSIIAVLIFARKSKEAIHGLGIFTIIALVGLLNPVSYRILCKFIGDEVYWRVFWIIPFVIIIPYSLTIICDKFNNKYIKIIVILVIAASIIKSGENMVRSSNYQPSENMYKLSSNTIDLCEIISDNKENDKENVKAVVVEELVCYIRQYDASIKLLYGRKDRDAKNLELLINVNLPVVDTDTFIRTIPDDCNHIIIRKNQSFSKEIEMYGWEIIGTSDNHKVYKLRQ